MNQRFQKSTPDRRNELPSLSLADVANMETRASQLSPHNPLRTTILLVDDDDDLRFITELIFSMNGYCVISCSGADFALTAFRNHPLISLLVTDMQMPGGSGIELARELTMMCPSLPVLIVSGRMPTSEAQVELRDRNWTFLSKTVEESTLLKTVGVLLEGS